MKDAVKFSPEVATKLAASVSSGTPITIACRLVGVSRQSYYNWLRAHHDFAAEMHRAEGIRQEGVLQRLIAKGEKDWRADSWVLERTSEDFREVKDVNLQVSKGVERVLDEVRAHMSEGAYGELIAAVAIVQGVAGAGAEQAADGDEHR